MIQRLFRFRSCVIAAAIGFFASAQVWAQAPSTSDQYTKAYVLLICTASTVKSAAVNCPDKPIATFRTMAECRTWRKIHLKDFPHTNQPNQKPFASCFMTVIAPWQRIPQSTHQNRVYAMFLCYRFANGTVNCPTTLGIPHGPFYSLRDCVRFYYEYIDNTLTRGSPVAPYGFHKYGEAYIQCLGRHVNEWRPY